MGIGTSKGAFYEDEFHYNQAQWDPNRYDQDNAMVVKPSEMYTNKALDSAEVDPATGIGIPVSGPEIDWGSMNKPFGSVKGTGPEDTPVVAKAAGGVTITEGDINRAIDVGMAAGPASIAGVRSLGLNKTKLYEAQNMHSNGAHPDEIWQQTGFFQGADGKWKYEIADQGSKIKESGWDKTILESNPKAGGERDILFTPKKGAKLPDVFDHPDLFAAYPMLKDMKIAVLPKEALDKGVKGSMDIRSNTMFLAPEIHPEFARSVILHEVQHQIQTAEGFARGGNTKEFLSKTFEEDFKAAMKSTDPDVRERMIAEIRQAEERYKRLMGEVEARNVQKRMDYNEARRFFNSPRNTEDRPRFVQKYAKDGEAVSQDSVPGQFTPYSKRWANNDNARPLNESEQFIKDYDELAALRNKLGTPRDGGRFGSYRKWSDLDYAKYNKAGREFAKKHGQEWEDVNPVDLTK